MKPLLTILLIAWSFGVKGQEWKLIFEQQPNVDFIKADQYWPIGEFRVYDDKGIKINDTPVTIDMIFDYVQECYEDSTLVPAHQEQVTGKGLMMMWIDVPDTWIHTTPTFEGFAEYLKRKYIK